MSENILFQFNPKKSLSVAYSIATLNGYSKKKNSSIDLKVNDKIQSWSISSLDSQVSFPLSNSIALKFFAVQNNLEDFYPISSDKIASVKIDSLLDEFQVDGNSVVKCVNQIFDQNQTNYLVSDKISLVDVAAWGIILAQNEQSQLTGKSSEWFNGLCQLPQFQDSQKIVDHLISGSQPNLIAEYIEAVPQYKENPILLYRYAVGSEIAKVLNLDAQFVSDSLEIAKSPKNDVSGFSIPTPKLRLKGNPQQIAEQLVSKMKTNQFIAEISHFGAYVNIKLNKDSLLKDVINSVKNQSQSFGTNKNLSGQTHIVEFSSPNIAKPFHAGHLRSTIIGNFVRNVLKANGAKTIAINYLGDWGKQYGLLALGFGKFGNEEDLTKDPIKHLFDVYVQISKMAKEDESINDQARAYFKKMEDGDVEALKLWSRFRNLSIEKYKKIYARLNIEFDIYSGESQFSKEMEIALKELNEVGILTESEGAKIVDLSAYNMNPALIQKSDGSTLYITRDIAAATSRYNEYKFQKMFYIVGNQQELHFRQLFKVLELSGHSDCSSKCTHIGFGLVNGMSTRKGNVVFLEDILNESQQVMLAKMKSNEEKYNKIENPEETADIIGLTAVMIQDMSAKRGKDYDFNWDRMTSFEGDTGPYLQYAHARLCSIERNFVNFYSESVLKTPVQNYQASFNPPLPISESILKKGSNPKLGDLSFILAQFPEIVASIPFRNYEPCNLVVYLMSICHKVSQCLDDVYVMDNNNKVEDKEILLGRFWAYWSARVVLGNGMRILGLKPLERM